LKLKKVHTAYFFYKNQIFVQRVKEREKKKSIFANITRISINLNN